MVIHRVACIGGGFLWRDPSSRLYIIKYYFISSMNIFYCCTDMLFVVVIVGCLR
jgi:hypothetical protein